MNGTTIYSLPFKGQLTAVAASFAAHAKTLSFVGIRGLSGNVNGIPGVKSQCGQAQRPSRHGIRRERSHLGQKVRSTKIEYIRFLNACHMINPWRPGRELNPNTSALQAATIVILSPSRCLVPSERLELSLDRLSTYCLCRWATRALFHFVVPEFESATTFLTCASFAFPVFSHSLQIWTVNPATGCAWWIPRRISRHLVREWLEKRESLRAFAHNINPGTGCGNRTHLRQCVKLLASPEVESGIINVGLEP